MEIKTLTTNSLFDLAILALSELTARGDVSNNEVEEVVKVSDKIAEIEKGFLLRKREVENDSKKSA